MVSCENVLSVATAQDSPSVTLMMEGGQSRKMVGATSGYLPKGITG